ncbi:type VII secretion integral membrane protein EccD [Mycobacterium koreense]|uniref:Type VII secretion integral membrane protein EccD n=1 Tax=Mycolicibacillus koreensis TaxID=1069220 RepID=A0A7I7SGT4_9MYCO|nr:type VII secretion integral membrane protein EccD [Mycolicibacillus koreensis]MCV7247087.1 type VII secretion integral membrane protein EccD [Mycolicibacillus koreensis]ODR09890.1 type VII secretion integral membrane protein EccD [Mycolicibacillus koreensis]OSC31888.1 type VII secretion integral membrane protein EccD [Mycolicibacillus koreensis]BBY55963.1 ESX-3 secretion system protein EccD3 [Mycolicibacillus koreensis]
MDPAIATGLVRVAVIGDDSAADLALPTKVSIRELIPVVRRVLASGRDDDDLSSEQAAEPVRPYSLRPFAGTPFSLDATLETMAVKDGEQLLLCVLPPGPAAPPVVEDIADAAAIHSSQQTSVFDPSTMLGPAALVVGVAALVLLCGLAGYGWYSGYPVWAQGTFGALAVTSAVATALLGRRDHGQASGILGVATVLPLGLALAAALPSGTPAPRLVLAAAGLFAWSLLHVAISSRWVATHAAVVLVSASVGLAAAARILWNFPYLTLGCALLTVALIVAIQAPTFAPVLARFPFFYVPAPGERVPAPLTLAEIEDLPRRAALSQSFQAGLVSGSVVLTVIGSVMVVWLPDAPSLLCWWLVVAVGMVTVLRIRLFGAAVPSLWFLASPLLTAVALTASFAATDHMVAAVWAAGVVVGLTALLIIAGVATPGALSIPRRGYLDIFENVLLYTILPTVVWLVGLISLIRNRSPL